MKTIMKATNILSKSLRLIRAAPTRDFRARITLPLLVSGLLATTGVSYGQNVVAQIPIPSSSQYSVDVNTSSNTVFVSGGASGGQTVTKINGNTNQVVGTIGAGSGAHVNSMTNRLYAGDVFGGHILVYDATTGTSLASISMPGCPIHASVDPSINRVSRRITMPGHDFQDRRGDKRRSWQYRRRRHL